MMVRGQFSQLMAPGANAIFVHFLDLLQRDEEFSHIFNMETSDAAFEDEFEITGVGPFQEKPEAESITYQDIQEGGSKRYIHLVYGLGVRCSFELYEDDQYNIINQAPKALARSAHFQKEQQSANVFNLGFTTVTVSDGLSLFHNQHPLAGGSAATALTPGFSVITSVAGTYPNRPATDVDLSLVALQLGINHFERMPDSSGMPAQIKPKLMVVAPENKWIAREILGSPHKPFTSDNEINSVLAEDLQYFVSHYLTSASAWYLLTDKSQHWLKFFTRRELDELFGDDFDTLSIKQISFMRISVGATTWYGTWGSNGP